MRHGAIITEKIIVDGLTQQGAYEIEKQKIEELHQHKRGQLWNTIDERLIGVTGRNLNGNRERRAFNDDNKFARVEHRYDAPWRRLGVL
jgi:hypothetical protein